MRLELTGRHVDITPTLRRLVEGKLGKLERLLNDSAVSAHAVLTREKHRHRADITLHARGEKFLHAVGNTGSWETSIAFAIEKIAHQAQKVKGKWQDHKSRRPKVALVAPAISVEREAVTSVKPAGAARQRRERLRAPRILRTLRKPLRAMSVAEAAREIEAGSDGIVVFRDVKTAAISVLYRRGSGELTLVETEA
jgi:putative sigma-54 modulation protein